MTYHSIFDDYCQRHLPVNPDFREIRVFTFKQYLFYFLQTFAPHDLLLSVVTNLNFA
uniref:Putative RNA AdoMet-dependent methyltransferase n=1 Tax=mine drainage metagenome TaxID=410659 RepID=E6QQZ9_9ZZZZ